MGMCRAGVGVAANSSAVRTSMTSKCRSAAAASEGIRTSMSESSRVELADERAAGRAALGAARRLEFQAGEIHEIQEQQLALELARNGQQDLERQQRLQRAESAGHRTEHARFGAVADDAIGRRVGPQAAQAGVRRARLVDLQLPLVLIDAGEDGGPLGKHRGIVDQELGAEIVAAIDHDVVRADQARAHCRR